MSVDKRPSIRMDIPINEIKPYWRNPRKSEKTISSLKESIQKFGYNVPIIVDLNRVIVSGHARFKALMQLGVETVTCMVADFTPDEAKEFRIIDNKIPELSSWNVDNLRDELKLFEDMAIFETLGFKEFELDILFAMPEIDLSASDTGDAILGISDTEDPESIDEDLEDSNDEPVEPVEESVTFEITCPVCLGSYFTTRADILGAVQA